ncbi:WhiB family transcriptional regulator [Kitasatospora sp. NPDC004669]|uniref:WhiB family transcriptional regulator n=1 Tax=Kitasatospora sp. NPDC004669 TaxID=3154555 RepID=UPI0033AC97C6
MTVIELTPARNRMPDPAWITRAACAGHPDPDVFYPLPRSLDHIAEAKRVCATCPVANACLTDALERGDRHGVRGGLTEAEREPDHEKDDKIRREDQRILAALAGVYVHLSTRERDSVIAVAELADIPAHTWAPVLGIGRKYALERMRKVRDRLANPHAYPEERRIAERLTAPVAVAA